MTPILMTLHDQIVHKQKLPTLFSKRTNRHVFGLKLDSLIEGNFPLKSKKTRLCRTIRSVANKIT